MLKKAEICLQAMLLSVFQTLGNLEVSCYISAPLGEADLPEQ